MSNTKITSEVRLVSEVLYSGRLEVPWHQRHYDWKVEQVSELLSDLKNALDTGKACYFLGSIMLVKVTDAKKQRINDGQQRLITLSLLIAAFCRRFAQKRPRDPGRETLALRVLFDRPDSQTSRLADTSRYEPRIQAPEERRLEIHPDPPWPRHRYERASDCRLERHRHLRRSNEQASTGGLLRLHHAEG